MATRQIQLSVLLLATLSLLGCHTQHRTGMTSLDRGPLHNRDRPARSLVMPGTLVSSANLDAPSLDAWYAGRNDFGPSVSVGYRSQTYDRSVTYTRDRQFISNGRVIDQYSQTTYRRTVREGTR